MINKKELLEKYPSLLPETTKVICAMEGESIYRGKIFNVLAEILSEYPADIQITVQTILKHVLKMIFLTFVTKSLFDKNKLRITFHREAKSVLVRMCDEYSLDNTLKTHLQCALDAVWTKIERDLERENRRIKFYETSMSSYTRYFIK